MAADPKGANVIGKDLSQFHMGFVHFSESSKVTEFHTFLAHLPVVQRPSKDLTLPSFFLSAFCLLTHLGCFPIMQERPCGREDNITSSDVRLPRFNSPELCDLGQTA